MSPDAQQKRVLYYIRERAALDGMRTILLLPLCDLHPVVCFRHVEHIANQRKSARARRKGEARGVHPAIGLRTGIEEGDVAKDDGGDEHIQEVELTKGKVKWDVESLGIHVKIFWDLPWMTFCTSRHMLVL